MIPEFANASEMKRVLEALFMDPARQDILLYAVLERWGVNAQALGRTGTQDQFHYASTFAFQLPSFLKPDDVCGILKKVARDARMTLYRWQINNVVHDKDGDWHSGIVTFFGTTPVAEKRAKYYDDPPKLKPVERYVMDVARRLKQRAELENRRALVELHGLLA